MMELTNKIKNKRIYKYQNWLHCKNNVSLLFIGFYGLSFAFLIDDYARPFVCFGCFVR